MFDGEEKVISDNLSMSGRRRAYINLYIYINIIHCYIFGDGRVSLMSEMKSQSHVNNTV